MTKVTRYFLKEDEDVICSFKTFEESKNYILTNCSKGAFEEIKNWDCFKQTVDESREYKINSIFDLGYIDGKEMEVYRITYTEYN